MRALLAALIVATTLGQWQPVAGQATGPVQSASPLEPALQSGSTAPTPAQAMPAPFEQTLPLQSGSSALAPAQAMPAPLEQALQRGSPAPAPASAMHKPLRPVFKSGSLYPAAARATHAPAARRDLECVAPGNAPVLLPLIPVNEETIWHRHNEDGVNAYQLGRKKEAIRLFRKALKAAERFGSDDLRVAAVLTNLGAALRDAGKLSAAEPYLARALDIKRKALPPGDPGLGTTMRHYAALSRRLGRFKEARMLEGHSDLIASVRSGRAYPWRSDDGLSDELWANRWSNERQSRPGSDRAYSGRRFPGVRAGRYPGHPRPDGFSAMPSALDGSFDDAERSASYDVGGFDPQRLVFRALARKDRYLPGGAAPARQPSSFYWISRSTSPQAPAANSTPTVHATMRAYTYSRRVFPGNAFSDGSICPPSPPGLSGGSAGRGWRLSCGRMR